MDSDSELHLFMPRRGQSTAPTFGSNQQPRQLREFFRDLEYLFEDCKITSDDEKKRHACRYLSIDDSDLWQTLPEYSAGISYNRFVEAVSELYPGSDERQYHPGRTTREPFVAAVERTVGYTHVLLITTGSVASIKAPLIVSELYKHFRVKVQVVSTKSSLAFFKASDVEREGARVWTDEDEWTVAGKFKIGDPILHIELRRWADIVLVAPCSANTLSKIANGLCDNLATSILRALAPTTPTYIFPAMNTLMYEHPLTSEHLRIVRDVVRYGIVGPIGKTLACGDVGVGAMTEWQEIVNIVVQTFGLQRRVPR